MTECIDGAIEKFTALGHSTADIKAVGITNQRETTIVWDKSTGEPLHNAIVWTDTRASGLVQHFKSQAEHSAVDPVALSGLRMSTYPSTTKLVWMIQNVDSVRKAYDAGTLCFGTIDTWLIHNLTAGSVFATDVTNASRTMFVDLHKLQYSSDLLTFFTLDRDKLNLPSIHPSSHPTAYGAIASGPLAGIPIGGVLGDQSGALVGHLGFEVGATKNTYGTGCFLLSNVGEQPKPTVGGLLSTVGYQFNGSKPVYALEGSIAVAGSAVKFLVDSLGFSPSPPELSALAETETDSGGVVFVTAFSGLFAPYWNDSVRGAIFGLTGGTRKGHIARACFEATALQTRAILTAVSSTLAHPLPYLTVDGGLSTSDPMMQIQADLAQIPVHRSSMSESSALGAAIAAGLGVGVWATLDDVKADIGREVTEDAREFRPSMPQEEADAKFAEWQSAVQRLIS